MIIGIVGFIGSGKDTVGKILQERYGFETESFAKPLKDACAAIFGWDRGMLEGKNHHSRDWREKVDPYWSKVLGDPEFSPRKALQLMGTEAGRKVFGEELWTASCIRRCQGITDISPIYGSPAIKIENDKWQKNYVITDCRFRNEIAAIKKANGIIFRVKRGDDPHWATQALNKMSELQDAHSSYEVLKGFMASYNATCTAPIHQSEWDWLGSPDIDFVIENDGNAETYSAVLGKKVHDILSKDLKLVHLPFVTYDPETFRPLIEE